MIINGTNGRVGIGVDSPDYKLSVAGKIEARSGGFIFPDGTIQTTAAGSGSSVWSDDGSGNVSYSGGNVGVGTPTAVNALDVNGGLSVGSAYAGSFSSPTDGMIVQGAVGINTNSPSNKLDVNGAVAVGSYAGSAAAGSGVDLIVSGDTGIGTSSPETRFHVTKSVSGNARAASNNVVVFENTGSGSSADVMMLKIGRQKTNIQTANNFITFVDDSNESMGAIEGNTNGGSVQYSSGAADFAEYLMREDPAEKIQAGDLVGVFGGKITRRTVGADHVMAISDQAAVAGNMPSEDKEHLYGLVGFIGQVPVRVRGSVVIGDYILPSGFEDGTGIAVSDLDPKDLPRVLGRAWEASNEEGIKRVNTVLGLTLGEAQAKAFADLRSEIAELKTENRAMRVALVEMAQMKAQMAMLQAAIGKLTQNGQRRVISTASVE